MLSANQVKVKTNCDLTRVTAPALATGCMFSRAHHWCHVFFEVFLAWWLCFQVT